MTSRLAKLIAGLIALLMVSVFVLGLAHSISTGFAGFWGGFPFVVIAVLVLALAVYDTWDECIRKKD